MKNKIKILAISAKYPPFHSGGYELRVKNIIDGLAALNHQILVLTNHPENSPQTDSSKSRYQIIRKLHNRRNARFFPKEVLFDLMDTFLLEKQIKEFQPNVVYLGHTYILSKALLPYLVTLNIPILYDEGGAGLVEAWTEHGRWFHFTGDYRSRIAPLNWVKPMAIALVCKLSGGRIRPDWSWPTNMKIVFNSQLNRNNAIAKGVPINDAVVIHSGVDLEKFTFRPREKMGNPLRIIVPGRIERRKGQLDVVELIAVLRESGVESKLVMAGKTGDTAYYSEVVDRIERYGLNDRVVIKPMLSTKELVSEYHQADICFFPSYQDVGFSRVPMEAMACGCIVISYGNEGSDEIIQDQINGFIVDEGNIDQVADIVTDLSKNPGKVHRITSCARALIEREHDMESYIDKIEKILVEAAA